MSTQNTQVTIVNRRGDGIAGRLISSEYQNSSRGRTILLSVEVEVGNNDFDAMQAMSDFFQAAGVDNVYRPNGRVTPPDRVTMPTVSLDTKPNREAAILTLEGLDNYDAISNIDAGLLKYDILVVEGIEEIYFWTGKYWKFISKVSVNPLSNAWRIGHTTGNKSGIDIRVYNGREWVQINEKEQIGDYRIYEGIKQVCYLGKPNSFEWMDTGWIGNVVSSSIKKPKKPVRKVHDIDISTEEID